MFGMKQVRNKQVGHLRGESFLSIIFSFSFFLSFFFFFFSLLFFFFFFPYVFLLFFLGLRGRSPCLPCIFTVLHNDLIPGPLPQASCIAILGRGSVLTEKGEVEMDAMMMEGDRLNSGAVACVSSVKNPIKLARSK